MALRHLALRLLTLVGIVILCPWRVVPVEIPRASAAAEERCVAAKSTLRPE